MVMMANQANLLLGTVIPLAAPLGIVAKICGVSIAILINTRVSHHKNPYSTHDCCARL